jgi:predicted Zn-dependent peptidase
MSMSSLLLAMPLLASIAGAELADTIPPTRAAAAVDTRPASVLVHRQAGLPVIVLRLSILADDPPGYAGIGHLIQHLHEPALHYRIDRIGGRVSIERNPDALVYTVTGPAGEAEYLAETLRLTLDAPRPTEPEFTVARQALAKERLAEWETAEGHVRSALRAHLFPADLPAAGTPASAARWDRSRLGELWASMYRPERVSVVAVGDVEARTIEAAFAGIPRASDRIGLPAVRDSVPGPVLAAPETTRSWLGIGYTAATAEPAVVTIAARLLQNHLRQRLPGSRTAAEHWWTHHGQAIALVVAAPEPALPAARRAIGSAVGTVLAEVDDESVRTAATAVRREMLSFSRVPVQMAELLGRFHDRHGDPEAAQRFFTELEQVRAADVRELLDAMLARSPARVELPSQQLPRRS